MVVEEEEYLRAVAPGREKNKFYIWGRTLPVKESLKQFTWVFDNVLCDCEKPLAERTHWMSKHSVPKEQWE